MNDSAVVIGRVLDMLGNVKGAQFARFTYRAKGTNELARHILLVNTDTKALYMKDVATLQALIPTIPLDQPLRLRAAYAILNSLQESLAVGIGHNSEYVHSPERADTYVTLNHMPNVKVHKRTGDVYVMGLAQDKVVLEPGVYKEIRSSPLTLAKHEIDKQLRRSHVRQFVLPNLVSCAIAGDTADFTHARSI